MFERLEWLLVFSPFEKQIERDVQQGTLSQEAADALLAKLQDLRVYARMQLVLYALLMTKRIAGIVVPPGVELLASNAIIEAAILTHRKKIAKALHAPGMLLLRIIPGIALCIGNIALLKAEPLLYDVSMRLCAYACHKLRLRFLIPIYIRPGMKLLRWVYQLEWPAFLSCI